MSSNADIAVVDAVVHRNREGSLVVSGDVRRPNGYAGVVPGYLRIEGKDARGNVISFANARWGEFNNRRLRQAYFRAVLPASDSAMVVSISISPVTSGFH